MSLVSEVRALALKLQDGDPKPINKQEARSRKHGAAKHCHRDPVKQPHIWSVCSYCTSSLGPRDKS